MSCLGSVTVVSFRTAMMLIGRSGIICEPEDRPGTEPGLNRLVSPCGLVVTGAHADLIQHLDPSEAEIMRHAHIRAHYMDGYGGGMDTGYDSQGQPWTFAIQTTVLDGIHHQIVGADPVAITYADQDLLPW